MNLAEFKLALSECPLVASVQASPGSPMQDPDALWRSAQASISQGVRVLRLQGEDVIKHIRPLHQGPIIGLIKQDYASSQIYITPTAAEVRTLISLGCEVIALDATPRVRPGDEELRDLVELIHFSGRLAMADCDSLESFAYARTCGCDIFSTTLAGYTPARQPTAGPDLELLRCLVESAPGAVLAEGRIQEPWQARAAMAIGADGVVIGGSLNDPVKQTSRFRTWLPPMGRVGAVDLGGTWLRFATMDNSLALSEVDRIPIPEARSSRMRWIKDRAVEAGVARLGISAGGTIDPQSNEVWEAKDFIPDYRGTTFICPGLECHALNDGLANAWGQAHRPDWAGMRVAVLALGTGVGAGLVDQGRIICGPRGEYPRWNDVLLPSGQPVEAVLGGLALTSEPTAADRTAAAEAALWVISGMEKVWMPDVIVVTGGVGLSPWMMEALEGRCEFGDPDSGLIGAGCLALYPPTLA